MGPRPEDRGKRGCRRRNTTCESAFNGATTRRSWKTGKPSNAARARGPFNGATTRRSWKTANGTIPIRAMRTFNGATTRRSWKTRKCLHERRDVDPSMGPRPEDRGKLHLSSIREEQVEVLQWGHDPKIVENLKIEQAAEWAVDLQWGHDPKIVENQNAGEGAADSHSPSMGPRPEDRGKLRVGSRGRSAGRGPFNGATTRRSWKTRSTSRVARRRCSFNGATTRRSWKTNDGVWSSVPRTVLQWGHDPKIVENLGDIEQLPSYQILQWGHDPKIVENVLALSHLARIAVPSMGPRPEDRGKRWTLHPVAGTVCTFNGATTRRSWKT